MASTPTDIVLVGTGIAPLVAAMPLIAQGISVQILNPLKDFFLEDLELAVEPFWDGPEKLVETFKINEWKRAQQVLSQALPGALEIWRPGQGEPLRRYLPGDAPFLREVSAIWTLPPPRREPGLLSAEDILVAAEAAGLHGAELMEFSIPYRFPGMSPRVSRGGSALMIHGLSSIDVKPYRNRLLEFVRERLGEENVRLGADRLELKSGEIHFDASNGRQSLKYNGVCVLFRSPRLDPLLKKIGVLPTVADRIWEDWTWVSRDPITPEAIGHIGNACIFAGIEGEPDRSNLHELKVWKPIASGNVRDAFSQSTIKELLSLAGDTLGWESVNLRAGRVRNIPSLQPVAFEKLTEALWIEHRASGSLVEVVDRAYELGSRISA